MGLVYKGLPEKIALDLRDEYNLNIFIETGTLIGNTARWASGNFKKVYTIEISYPFYVNAREKLSDCKNIQVIYGKSIVQLPRILKKIDEPVLFWLDAHWSKDLGHLPIDAILCPILGEIQAISLSDHKHIILIDDFRLFGVERGWPSKDEVQEALEAMGKKISFFSDIFVAIPK